MADQVFDFAVIGAGIAGSSVAAELAREASVLLLEMEAQPGYHTTGRSAATFAPGYGPQPIRALTRASAAFFHAPPDGFGGGRLLNPRGVLMIARGDQLGFLDDLVVELADDSDVRRLDAEQTVAIHPLLREGYAHAALLVNGGSDIDVHALHHGFLKAFRNRNGRLVTGAAVVGLKRNHGVWQADTPVGPFRAAKIVNAAGAWADQIGDLAGAEHIGLVPKRRTALLIAAPENVDVDPLPLVVDIEEQFYMKPDAGRLLVSPANEDPVVPCDVQPEELDIALCVDRIERAFDLRVRRIESRWAGLRSFVADKSPVAGWSQQADGFFWLAAQGGYGIQSAPALARLSAALALGAGIPKDILDQGLDPANLSPERLETGS